MPDAGPSNPEPDLLPESGELPARLPPELPSKLSPDGASPQSASKNEGRFDEIRSLAMSSPRAAYLLKRARHSSNSASRHLYLRAYYVTVASQMRKLDPNLKSSIDAYEETQIHEISGAHTATARAAFHRSRVHGTASQEASQIAQSLLSAPLQKVHYHRLSVRASVWAGISTLRSADGLLSLVIREIRARTTTIRSTIRGAFRAVRPALTNLSRCVASSRFGHREAF